MRSEQLAEIREMCLFILNDYISPSISKKAKLGHP